MGFQGIAMCGKASLPQMKKTCCSNWNTTNTTPVATAPPNQPDLSHAATLTNANIINVCHQSSEMNLT